MLSIVRGFNCKGIPLGDKDDVVKAWMIQDGSRTDYMSSAYPSMEAMATGYGYMEGAIATGRNDNTVVIP